LNPGLSGVPAASGRESDRNNISEVNMAKIPNGTLKLVEVKAGHKHTISQRPLPAIELQHFRNIVGSVTQDALKVWVELWAQLEGRVVSGVAVLPEAKKGFEPSCGWPEFLEKMCVLRHYLDFTNRLSQQ
jgi:hypothetical protein